MAHLQQILERIDSGLPASLERLFELLRFPTVGTDPRYHGDCRMAAAWLKSGMEAMGFTASLRDTAGQPVVVAKYAPEDLPSHAPHVLFYGHYDVQPPDPSNCGQARRSSHRSGKGKTAKIASLQGAPATTRAN